MIFKDEISGPKLKKALQSHNVLRCHQRWHNQNQKGGNFGINIIMNPRHKFGKDYQLIGEYDTEKRITALKFGKLFQGGSNYPINNLYTLTFAQLIDIIKNRIDTIIAIDILTTAERAE